MCEGDNQFEDREHCMHEAFAYKEPKVKQVVLEPIVDGCVRVQYNDQHVQSVVNRAHHAEVGELTVQPGHAGGHNTHRHRGLEELNKGILAFEGV